ncbi:MAG: hypothetical protein QOH54_3277 [Mycobacterium sp.]|jgi:hypothetical protein|nr:hypothetical protein [Mycobacterium sp.]
MPDGRDVMLGSDAAWGSNGSWVARCAEGSPSEIEGNRQSGDRCEGRTDGLWSIGNDSHFH